MNPARTANSMRTWLVSFLALCLSAASALAGTATEAARDYYSKLRAGDYDGAAEAFHPAELESFRKMLGFMTELPDETAAEVLATFFGKGATKESVTELSDADFFASFFSGVMKQAQVTGDVAFGDLEVLGEVPEGDDIVHVVTRNEIGVGKLKIKSMEVMSFKKSGEAWKTMLTGEMTGMAAQVKAALGL